MEDNGMTREELISLTIDKYTDLQRIKKSNGGVENKNLIIRLRSHLQSYLHLVYPSKILHCRL